MAGGLAQWRRKARELLSGNQPTEAVPDPSAIAIAASGLFNSQIYSGLTGATGSEIELIQHYIAEGDNALRETGAPQDSISRISSFYDAIADQDYEGWANANWIGPEIAFGMMYPYLTPGQTINDFGVGTGLSAIPFKRAGCDVIGLDASAEMLEVCRQSGACARLFQHDLGKAPYPLNDAIADHALSTGVLHFIPDLDVFVSEVARTTRPGATLYLDVVDVIPDHLPVTRWGFATTARLKIHLHSRSDVVASLQLHGFKVLKSCPFFFFDEIFQSAHGARPARFHFQAYLARKME